MEGFGLLGLLGLLLSGSKTSPARGGGGSRPAPSSPGYIPSGAKPLPPAPWPCVVPKGLPPFPGKGWVYDEPPPIVVQQRAGQLVDQLWAQGSGACKVEQTAGRWITYTAQVVRSGKRGVVAYRLAAPASSPKPPAAPPATLQMPPLVITSPGFVPTSVAVPTIPRQQAPAPGTTRIPVPGGSIDVRNAPSPLSLPTLRRGMGLKPQAPNADVTLLQQKLAIPADGRFGDGTLAAVKLFQKKNGLTQDGIVGPNTWTSLFGVRA